MGRCRKRLIPETALFLVFFLLFLVRLMLVDGFAVNPETQEVFMQPYKYFINLIEMPAGGSASGRSACLVWYC